MGGKSDGSEQIVGYKYFLGMHMACCHGPIDTLLEITVGEKKAWPLGDDAPPVVVPDPQQEALDTGGFAEVRGRPPATPPEPGPPIASGEVTSSDKLFINAPELFGGVTKEGGVQGYVDVTFGEQDLPANDYLVSVLGNVMPAFRNLFCLIARQCYVSAMNPYIKPWIPYARRVFAQWDGQPQWYAAKAAIGEFDMNPAHILRECLTNKLWGKAYDVSTINDTMFHAAADRLYEENFGLSFLWTDPGNIDGFIDTVLQHIDASIYTDRATGQWCLKLVRDDFVYDDLLVLNTSNIISLDDFSRPTPSDLYNQVVVTYWDRATRKNTPLILDNEPLQDINGGTVKSYSVDRTGICEGDLAAFVVQRELRSATTALAHGSINVNRAGLTLNTGDAFIFQWAPLGIVSIVMRVTSIDYGSLEDGQVSITMVEDVFALPTSQYIAPVSSAWVDPRQPPAPALQRYVGELPYWTIIKQLTGESGYSQLTPTANGLAVGWVRRSPDTSNGNIWVSSGTYAKAGSGAFCPSVKIAAAHGKEAPESLLVYSNPVDGRNITYGTYAAWDSELVMVVDFHQAAGTLLVRRGVLDTVPQEHDANSVILFLEGAQFIGRQEYEDSEAVSVKITPKTSYGELKLADAPIDTYTFKHRHVRPYAPGNFKINSVSYPDRIAGPLTVTWSHRNRKQQTAYLVAQDESDIGPEPGTTYTLRLYNEADALVKTVAGITGTTYTWSSEDTDSGLVVPNSAWYDTSSLGLDDPQYDTSYRLNTQVRVELESTRDDYISWQAQTHIASRHGYGTGYGESYGD